ncbi:MAG: carbamoyl phosphate synthase small subunit [Clostridia bacterium]|nr:carbamoyl phosphate synthase small subunit [Clostridia bacterium]
MDKKVYITLQNGKVFEGYSFGAEREAVGELVFTTGMSGYLETLTDPSYFGQIVTQTFPLIGNFGVIPPEFASRKCRLAAYVVREKYDSPEKYRSEKTLEVYLKEQGVPAVYGIDTRELTRIVREAGVMNAAITFKPLKDTSALNSYKIEGAVQATSCEAPYEMGESNGPCVVLYDFGASGNIARELEKRGCRVIVVPANFPAEQALAMDPDGIVLSDGPGNPAENTDIIENLKKLAGKKPVFGIDLGHQLFALAMGGATRKMKYGHRGANQPVKKTASGRVYISLQNHGYEVVNESVKCATLSYVNANDGSCEGLEYPQLNAFTVQFHPETCGGPLDTNFLFDDFMESMKR